MTADETFLVSVTPGWICFDRLNDAERSASLSLSKQIHPGVTLTRNVSSAVIGPSRLKYDQIWDHPQIGSREFLSATSQSRAASWFFRWALSKSNSRLPARRLHLATTPPGLAVAG